MVRRVLMMLFVLSTRCVLATSADEALWDPDIEDASDVQKTDSYDRDVSAPGNVRDDGGSSFDGASDVLTPPPGFKCTVTYKNGEGQSVTVPDISWTVKTGVGTVHIPASMMRRISASEEHGVFKAVSIYGDQLVGEVSPSSVSADVTGPDGGVESVDIQLAQAETLAFANPMTSPGDKAFRWRAKNGQMYVGEPVQKMLSVKLESGEVVDIMFSAVDSLVLVDDRNVSVRTADKTVRIGNPVMPVVTVGMSCGGSPVKLAWSELETVLRADQNQPSADKPSFTSKSVPAKEVLRKKSVPLFQTGMGETRFKDNALRRVVSIPKGDRVLLKTVYGEFFHADGVAVDRLKEMFRVKPVESNGLLSVRMDLPDGEVPAGYVAWMLKNGDRFYAKLAGESADSCKDMVLMERSDGGELTWMDTSGERREVKASGLIVKLLSATGETSIRVETVDAVKPGLLSQLPPCSGVAESVVVEDPDSVLMTRGEFDMGRSAGEGMDDEVPMHKVSVRSFRIDACEVTRAQFSEFVERAGYRTGAEKSGAGVTWKSPGFAQGVNDPVVCVSWLDAVEFCNWRSKLVGLDACYTIDRRKGDVSCDRGKNGYRLPTEAEWEYSARSGGKSVVYPWGNDLPTGIADGSTNQVFPANYTQREDEPQDPWIWTSYVKNRASNASGLYDMGGNVWEWCQDSYHKNAYRLVHVHKAKDPCVEESDVGPQPLKVMRGGSFANSIDMLRCASRGSGAPSASASRVGFRCVRTVVDSHEQEDRQGEEKSR